MSTMAITVWKDGSSKVWRAYDAALAEGDPDWLTTIPLPAEVDPEMRNFLAKHDPAALNNPAIAVAP